MRRQVVVGVAVLTVFLAAGSLQADLFRAGREVDSKRDASFRLTAGQITDFKALVQETTRELYDVTGETWKQDRANRFDLNDFNIDDAHYIFGLSFEKGWKYFTWQLDGAYMQMNSEAEARRDYYLEVGSDISFQGQTYNQLLIEEGSRFSFDVQGGVVETRLLFTPFTFSPVAGVRLTPFLDVGLFGFVGNYDIDAGETRGVTQYQNPPESFAVGGEASGMVGMGLPQYGGGAEVRVGSRKHTNFVLQGHYVLCQYSGGSSWLTSAEHREKRADIDHWNARVRAFLEVPLNRKRYLTFGVQYQQIDSKGSITSRSADPDEVIARRERFNKDAEFSMQSLSMLAGLTF